MHGHYHTISVLCLSNTAGENPRPCDCITARTGTKASSLLLALPSPFEATSCLSLSNTAPQASISCHTRAPLGSLSALATAIPPP